MTVLSIEQWAQREGVPVRRVYRLIKSKRIPTVKRKIEVQGIQESCKFAECVKS